LLHAVAAAAVDVGPLGHDSRGRLQEFLVALEGRDLANERDRDPTRDSEHLTLCATLTRCGVPRQIDPVRDPVDTRRSTAKTLDDRSHTLSETAMIEPGQHPPVNEISQAADSDVAL
jgi:hypothetical protein